MVLCKPQGDQHEECLHVAALCIRFNEHIGVNGEAVFRHACTLGLEGVPGLKMRLCL